MSAGRRERESNRLEKTCISPFFPIHLSKSLSLIRTNMSLILCQNLRYRQLFGTCHILAHSFIPLHLQHMPHANLSWLEVQCSPTVVTRVMGVRVMERWMRARMMERKMGVKVMTKANVACPRAVARVCLIMCSPFIIPFKTPHHPMLPPGLTIHALLNGHLRTGRHTTTMTTSLLSITMQYNLATDSLMPLTLKLLEFQSLIQHFLNNPRLKKQYLRYTMAFSTIKSYN